MRRHPARRLPGATTTTTIIIVHHRHHIVVVSSLQVQPPRQPHGKAHAFEVVAPERTYVLAAPKGHVLQEWVRALSAEAYVAQKLRSEAFDSTYAT